MIAKRFGVIATLLLFVLSLATVVSAAIARAPLSAPRPLAWPQSFSLLAGEKAEYGVAMTQAGDITVDVQWTGAPLIIVIHDPAGKAMTSVEQRNPSTAKISYSVVEADPKGALWTVTILAPGSFSPKSRQVASGQITVQSPAAPSEKVNSLAQIIRTQSLANVRTIAQRTPAQLPAIFKTGTKAVPITSSGVSAQSLNATMATRSTAYSDSMTKLASVARQTAGISSTMVKPKTGVTVNVPGGKIRPLALPTLTDVSPAQAHGGEQVWITGKNIPADKAQSQVFFVIGHDNSVAQDVIAPGPILESVTSGTDVKYRVEVPCAWNATQAYAGQVYVAPNNSDVTSNTLPLQYLPPLQPTATAAAPNMAEPDATVRLDGMNFMPTSEVHFVINGSDMPSKQVQFFSGQQITAKVPAYSSRQDLAGQVYVVNKTAANTIKGPLYGLAFKQTVPVTAGVINTSGQSGDPVLITGSGFRGPLEVHFITETGNDMPANVTASDECSVRTTVPDRDGVSAPTTWKVYVKSAGVMSNMVDFTWKPTMVTQLLDLNAADIQHNSDFKGTGIPWGEIAAIATIPYAFIVDLAASIGSSFGGSDEWSNDATGICAYHEGGLLGGNKDNDVYFNNPNGFRLKNGWVLDHVEFKASSDPNEANAYIWDSKEGTDWPYVLVHWWDSAGYDSVSYNLGFVIRGPKGVPYM